MLQSVLLVQEHLRIRLDQEFLEPQRLQLVLSAQLDLLDHLVLVNLYHQLGQKIRQGQYFQEYLTVQEHRPAPGFQEFLQYLWFQRLLAVLSAQLDQETRHFRQALCLPENLAVQHYLQDLSVQFDLFGLEILQFLGYLYLQ